MSLGPRKVVDGAPPQPPLYTLFGAAQSVDEPDDRWINGLKVAGYSCGPGHVYDPCGGSAGSVTLAPAAAADAYDVDPYVAWLDIKCRAAHGSVWEQIQGRARVAFAAYEAFAFEREFWTGATIPGNRHLAAGAAVTQLNGGVATSVRNATGLLEQCIGNSGARGMIHAPPAVASDMAQSGGAHAEGSRLVTPLGTIVIPGTGYPGTAPDGSTPPANQYWVYATGIVWARREPQPRVIPGAASQSLNRITNDLDVRVERAYAAGWDGCLHSAVLVDRSKTTF